MRTPWSAASLIALVGCLVAVAASLPGAAPESAPDPGRRDPGLATTVRLPRPNADWDYQIGGGFPPAVGVRTVSRDRHGHPRASGYNVCYVNAFQTQSDERSFWHDNPRHWALVLKKNGRAVVDSVWGEWLLDTRTAAKRHALARIVGRWVAGCADDGFDAVEYDNLDSWGRSKHLVTVADNVALARLLTARAHHHGMAAAQKNAAGLSARGPRIGFDFAIAEECGRYHECGVYARAYDDRVLVVEYRNQDFRSSCRHWGDRLSIVRRDVHVTPDGPDRRC